MREFITKTTTVGGSVGIVIPYQVRYAENIAKFQKVRVTIEPYLEPGTPAAETLIIPAAGTSLPEGLWLSLANGLGFQPSASEASSRGDSKASTGVPA